jgi:hypothetical protein
VQITFPLTVRGNGRGETDDALLAGASPATVAAPPPLFRPRSHAAAAWRAVGAVTAYGAQASAA